MAPALYPRWKEKVVFPQPQVLFENEKLKVILPEPDAASRPKRGWLFWPRERRKHERRK